MIKKLYLEDAGVVNTKTKITSIETAADGRSFVRLEIGIFHPAGGGQKADRGVLDGVRLTDVRKSEDGEIDHYVGCVPSDWIVGRVVTASVDTEWRRLNSALHTGGHLLAGCIEKRYPALTATQGHHWPGESSVTFEGELTGDFDSMRRTVQHLLRENIDAGLAVRVVGDPYLDRKIEIDGFAAARCGGTHLSHLGEVEAVEIRNIRRKRGKLRIGYDIHLDMD